MLTLTIKATTEKAVERLLKALVGILTPAEMEAFKKKMQKEIKRVERAERK